MTQGILPLCGPSFAGRSLFSPLAGAERYLYRDRSYGNWHRPASIGRFMPAEAARSLTMADLDSVLFAEYHWPIKLPLCLVEVAQDIGQEKPAGVIRKLAELAGIPAYVALYRRRPQRIRATPTGPISSASASSGYGRVLRPAGAS